LLPLLADALVDPRGDRGLTANFLHTAQFHKPGCFLFLWLESGFGNAPHPQRSQRLACRGQIALVGNCIFPKGFAILSGVDNGIHQGIEAFLGADVEVAVGFLTTVGGSAQETAVDILDGLGDVKRRPVEAAEEIGLR
jgi:hypothetical protein